MRVGLGLEEKLLIKGVGLEVASDTVSNAVPR